jgi:hypothetical protein
LSSNDNELANLAIPYIEKVDPHLTNDRTEKELPKLTASSALIPLARRIVPYTLILEPKRLKPRSEKLLPTLL